LHVAPVAMDIAAAIAKSSDDSLGPGLVAALLKPLASAVTVSDDSALQQVRTPPCQCLCSSSHASAGPPERWRGTANVSEPCMCAAIGIARGPPALPSHSRAPGGGGQHFPSVAAFTTEAGETGLQLIVNVRDPFPGPAGVPSHSPEREAACLQAITHMLDPQGNEFACAFIGPLISTLILQAGPLLGDLAGQVR
jgi:hypothetical protein